MAINVTVQTANCTTRTGSDLELELIENTDNNYPQLIKSTTISSAKTEIEETAPG